MTTDPYHTLGLPPGAGLDEVKLAYRRLAKACHPDLAPENPQASQRFQDLCRAYDTLVNQLERHAGRRPRVGPAPDRSGDRTRVRVKAPRRGADLAARIDVTVEEFIAGAERLIELAAGVMVRAKLPPGMEPGSTLRFADLGAPGRDGGPSGDGLVTLRLAPHSHFRLDGADVHLRLEASERRLAAGGFVRTPTPYGEVQLRIPKGAHAGVVLRLKGKGLPARGQRPAGDFFVTLAIADTDPGANPAPGAETAA